MGGIEDYISRQSNAANRAGRNVKFAERIRENLRFLNSMSDLQLRIYHCNKRINMPPSFMAECSDPVYKKLMKAERTLTPYGKSPLYPGMEIFFIESDIQRLKTKIERRKMTQEEYDYIKNTPIRVLFKKWDEDAKKMAERYG